MELSEAALKLLDGANELEGLKQKVLLSRIVESWASMDRPCRQLFIGTLPLEYAQDAAERMVRHLTNRIASLQGAENAAPQGRPKIDGLVDIVEEPAATASGRPKGDAE